MKKLILPLLAISLFAAACSASNGASDTTDVTTAATTAEAAGTTVVESATSTKPRSPDDIAVAELVADAKLIESLFDGYSAEWFVSLEAATTYIAQNVHAPLGCTPESALATYGGVEGQRESIVVLGETVERADDWVMPIGPSSGEPIEGRIYFFITETTVSVPGLDDVVTQDEAHATVIGDNAYFFFQCWDSALSG